MVLHDRDDAECVTIPANCRRAMNPGGKVVAVEMVLGVEGDGWFPYFLDLQILVCLFGRERTEDEFRALYAVAGLRLTRIVRTASLFSLVEGVAA